MRLTCIETGVLRGNNYFLENEANGKGVLIDCGGSGEDLILAAQKAGVTVEAILLTHGHVDHIEGVPRVAEHFACPVYLHQYDLEYPERPERNLSMQIYMKPLTYAMKPIAVQDGDIIEVAGFSIEVIHTPGHTQGSVCYGVKDILFTGDTLFRDSVGGDFPPFGNLETEIQSIRKRLFTLEGDRTCYPGHGVRTSLSYEMKNNMYCRI